MNQNYAPTSFALDGHSRSVRTADLRTAFHEAMLNRHRKIRGVCPRTATNLFGMMDANGGLAAAERVIGGRHHTQYPKEGSGHIFDCFTRLWLAGRLDLTVEALAVQEPWRQLFTPVQLSIAEQRLKDCGYRCEGATTMCLDPAGSEVFAQKDDPIFAPESLQEAA